MDPLQNNVTDDCPVLTLDIDSENLPDCNYVDIDAVSTFGCLENFSLLLFNVRSCRKNFSEFEGHFHDYFKYFSCIALVETWLSNDYDNLFSIHGFHVHNVCRNNFGGGIRLYCKDGLNVNVMPEFSFVTDMYEMLTVLIACNDNKFALSVLYHPPTSDHHLNNAFIESYCGKLKLIQTLGYQLVACGDYNLNLLNPMNYGFISNFIGNMLELGLYPAIRIPTKYNPENTITKYSILDHVWTTMSGKVSNASVFPVGITDHYPLMVVFDFSNAITRKATVKKRCFNYNNNCIFTRLLLGITLTLINGDMNSTFNTYFTKVWDIYTRAFPLIPLRIKDSVVCPWMTPNLRICIRKKSALYRMYVRGTIQREDYTLYKNRLTSLIRRVKRLYYYNLFVKIGKNTNQVWYSINLLLGRNSRVVLNGLRVGSSFLVGKDMVEYANKYFVNIANNLTAHLGDQYYVPTFRPNLTSFIFFPTNVQEVCMIIRKLKNKGNGIIDISVITLKKNIEVFSSHLSILYNYSIESVIYPELLKFATVVPGHKSGSRESIDNYRPISNLPVLSKIFEKLTLNRMISFVDQHKLLSESQFGFRTGRNITQAALMLTTHIVQAYHKRMYVSCFFLDLRKAFDTIDHVILLRKLYYMGFREPVNNYLKSYLNGRKQHVQVENFESDNLTITKGVPQGSVLGPLLFNLYINDIVSVVDAEVVLFADDAAFIISAPTLPDMYDKIKQLFSVLNEYLTLNKLVPNLGKSKLMYFSSRPCLNLEELMFADEIIEWVEEFKYLGLSLTNRMSYSCHIEKISTRISQYIGIFYNLNKILPREVLLLLYHSFILPHLSLHILLWGSAPDVYINKLKVKQNKLLRAILDVEIINGIPQVRTMEMYSTLRLLNVHNLFKFQLFNFLNSLLNGTLPAFYDLILRPLILTHGYNTRTGNFRHPLVVCDVEKRAVAHQLILLYDEVHEVFNTDLSTYTLLKRYKKYLLENQIG